MNKVSLKLSLSLFFLFLTAIASSQNMKQTKVQDETKFPEASAYEKSKFTFNIIKAANNTFGYDIIADGKLLIHQPSKPGMPGNEGFKTTQSAEKVAQLVISKIKKGEMPPTVTQEEMQNLKAIN